MFEMVAAFGPTASLVAAFWLLSCSDASLGRSVSHRRLKINRVVETWLPDSNAPALLTRSISAACNHNYSDYIL